MKLCAILLSLSGLIGGGVTILDSRVGADAKPAIAYSPNSRLAVPSIAPPDPGLAVGEALADAQTRDTSIAQLFESREDQ